MQQAMKKFTKYFQSDLPPAQRFHITMLYYKLKTDQTKINGLLDTDVLKTKLFTTWNADDYDWKRSPDN